jgi:hypothetical protein
MLWSFSGSSDCCFSLSFSVQCVSLDTPPYGLAQDESIPLNRMSNPKMASESWLAYENSRLSGWQVMDVALGNVSV